MIMNDVPYDKIRRIQSELQSGEAIRWISQANPRATALAGIGIFLFAIPWTAFSIFWICGAAGFKVPDFKDGIVDFFPLFGIPFVLIGLGMMLSPVSMWRKAKRTYYIVTDRRAVIFEDKPVAKIQSFGPEKLQSLERTQRPDGSGSLIFEDRVSRNERRIRMGFIGIKNVKEVESLINDIVPKLKRA
jgi:hypothetical protein